MATTTSPSSSSPCTQDGDFKAQMLVIAGIGILFGLIICLMGYKLFKFILFITGFFVGFFATYVLCSLYMDDKIQGDARKHKDQIYLALSFGVGVIGGLLTLCLYYVGMFVLGATMGWFIAMSLLPFAKAHTSYLAENMWLPYSVCAGSAVLGGLVILCVQKAVIILSTAFVGGMMVINGLDYFVEKGRVVNFTVHLLQGDHVRLPNCWYTWLVLSFLPIVVIVGIIVQYVKTSKGSDHRIATGKVLVIDAHQMYEMDDETSRPLLQEEGTQRYPNAQYNYA